MGRRRGHERRDALRLFAGCAIAPFALPALAETVKTMREDTERWGRIMRETNFRASE
jgi:hypothetical protein